MKLFHISRIRIACTLLLILSKSTRTSAWGFVQDVIEAIADEVADAANTLADTAETTVKAVGDAVDDVVSISGESVRYVVGEAAKATEDFAESGVDNIVHVVNEGIRIVERVADFTSELVDEAIDKIIALAACLQDEFTNTIATFEVDFDIPNLKIKMNYDMGNANEPFERDRKLQQGEEDKPQKFTSSNGIQMTVYDDPIFELNDNIGENDIVSDVNKFGNSSIDDHILLQSGKIQEFNSGCDEHQYCAGGVAGKVGAIIKLTPDYSLEFDGKEASATVNGYFTATASAGLSIVAAGSCTYAKEFYFPAEPKNLATGCYFAMCVMVMGQGKIEISLQGTLLAGARAVTGIEFKIGGSATIDLDNPDELNADFSVDEPTTGWQVDAYGEMLASVTFETGVIISVWVTPGVVINTYPYLKLQTTLFGSMAYEHGEGTVPDASLTQFSFPTVACSASKSVSQATYTKKTVDGTVEVASTTTTGNNAFSTKNAFDDTESCLAIGQSLRAGIEISAGGLPKGMQDILSKATLISTLKGGNFCTEFARSLSPDGDKLEKIGGSYDCINDSIGLDLPSSDDVTNAIFNAACEVVLTAVVTVATAVSPAGLHIPLIFPNGKECFDIFKVGAGPDSCMKSVGCGDLPQGVSLEYPTSDMEQDDFDTAGYTGWQATWTRIASLDGKKAFICGVSSFHEDSYEDRRFKFKYCRPADAPSTLQNAKWLATTEYSGNWARECPDNRFLQYVKSWYDTATFDRRFTFKCAEFDGYRKGALCGWSEDGDWVNSWDGPFTTECGEGKAITGIKSQYWNVARDRMYSFKCCPFKKIGATNKSQWTDFVNDWNEEFEVWAEVDGTTGALSGVASYHNNNYQDRQFKFRYSIPTGHSGAQTKIWAGWTTLKEHFKKSCGGGSWVIIYIKSKHTNDVQDRQFQWLCGRFGGYTIGNCEWTDDWVNDENGGFTFECGEDRAISGIESIYSGTTYDRKFKFRCCQMEADL